jgi:hypothetical protein
MLVNLFVFLVQRGMRGRRPLFLAQSAARRRENLLNKAASLFLRTMRGESVTTVAAFPAAVVSLAAHVPVWVLENESPVSPRGMAPDGTVRKAKLLLAVD